MSFEVKYDPLVLRDDLPKLSELWKTKIRFVIEHRLAVHPHIFGKPLRGSLAGYRKMRVGDYRIVFALEVGIVEILAIKHRSIVYPQVKKRIK